MPIVSAVNIEHSFGDDIILRGATLVIEAGERVGVVGRNGAGKSTLLRAMGGLIKPDRGEIQTQRGARIAYLRQDPDLDPEETLRDAAEAAFGELHALHQQLHALYDEMAEAPPDRLDTLMKRQARIETAIEAAGGYAIDHRIDAALHGLGFTDAQFAIKCEDLSGGQRARLALARILLEEPDVLLLDEPTNHLDIYGRLWLEEFLRDEFKGAVVMITHDRYMLDSVVSRIAEVEHGRLIDYPGNYAKFRKIRFERRLTQQRAYEKQQTKFRTQEEYIRRYKTGQRAKEARGRQSKLEREREGALERPMELQTFKFQMPRAPRSGDVVISARGASKRYENVDHQSGDTMGNKVLFDDFDVAIGRGERWGIIGPNGAGKTTLVRCLLGEQDADAGDIKLGSNVRVGFFRQSQDHMDPDQIVYRHLQQIIRKENPGAELSEQQARDLAGAFLFSGDEQEKELGVLSGGERARTSLAGLLASAKNLIVLDEPTNHLDIPSAERLEEALTADPKDGGYEGALLLISHDRALIDATCDHIIALDGHGGAEVFFGDYSAWRARELEKASEAKQAEEEQRRQRQAEEKKAKAVAHAERQQRQKLNSTQNKLAALSMNSLEERIEKAETRLKEIDAQLGDPDVWKDASKSNALSEERTQLASELEPLEFEWARRAEDG